MDGYAKLGNAVVLTACKDYLRARRRLKRRFSIDDQAIVDECTHFFKSQYFNTFTLLDGNQLLDYLDKEFK